MNQTDFPLDITKHKLSERVTLLHLSVDDDYLATITITDFQISQRRIADQVSNRVSLQESPANFLHQAVSVVMYSLDIERTSKNHLAAIMSFQARPSYTNLIAFVISLLEGSTSEHFLTDFFLRDACMKLAPYFQLEYNGF